jgi:hypothetical protein
MTDREVGEKLAWLCHLEYEGGTESVEAEIAGLPSREGSRGTGHAPRDGAHKRFECRCVAL